MPDDAKHIPILLVDMAGFSRLKAVPEQRAILKRLDDLLFKVLKVFAGRIDPRRAFTWQSTGDGYYITLKGCSSPVAMRFAQDLEAALLEEHNADYPLRLRLGLVLGDVEVMDLHATSQAKTEAARLVDHAWTRKVLELRDKQPLVVVASTLFWSDWKSHPDKEEPDLQVTQRPWRKVEFSIKHGEQLSGYLQANQALIEQIKKTYPQETSQPSVAHVDMAPWLQTLLDRTSYLEIRGIGSGRKDAGRYPIESLYTPLRSRGERAERWGGEPEDTPLSALLPKHSRLLIEGQPGAGKTTFLRLIAAMLCRDGLNIPCPHGKSWRNHYLGLTGEELPVPLFLRLSELASLLAEDKPHHPVDDGRRLLDLLENQARPENSAVWRKHWTELLAQGKAMVLLDGMDEVADEAIRGRVLTIVQDAIRQWQKCPLVVSSRPFGVEQIKKLGFHHVVIEPFGRQEVQEFIGRWSAALHEEAASRGIGREHRHKLEQAILERPTIRLLAANPVMLTCLCVVHWNEGDLPEARARVYQAVIRWLLASRKEWREKFHDEFALDAFATLALTMMQGEQGKKVAVIDLQLAAEAVQAVVTRFFPSESNPVKLSRTWLTFECLGSGIVEETGQGKLKFWHLTFQEYLAALALALLGDGEQEGEDYWPHLKHFLVDSQWRETVELFPGALYDEGRGRRVNRLLQKVLSQLDENPSLPAEARVVGIMGRLLQPMNAFQYYPPTDLASTYQQLLNRTMAIFSPEGAEKIPIKERILVAEVLGRSGDPRLAKKNFQNNLIKVPGAGGWRLGKYLVTIMEYQEFVEHGGYHDGSWWDENGWILRMSEGWETPRDWDGQIQHPTRPVTYVSWFEATAYCRWLSTQKNMPICLPDKDLWSLAAGDGYYPWGNQDPTPEHANYDQNVKSPTPVGLYPMGNGPYEHCDLAGNVWEWQRNLGENPLPLDIHQNPEITKDDLLALRGGSWGLDAGRLYSSARYRSLAWDRFGYAGFRIASAPKDSES